MTAGISALVSQVAVLVDMKSMLLSRAAVESPQTHLYRYVACLLHSCTREHVVSARRSMIAVDISDNSLLAAMQFILKR